MKFMVAMASSLAVSGFTFDHVLVIGGIVLITVSLLIRIRKRRQEVPRRLTAGEQLERARQKHGLRGDIEELMVEVEQLAKRFGAQLDAKSIQLERLIRQADERIEKLQRLESRVASTKSVRETSPVAISEAISARSLPHSTAPAMVESHPKQDPLAMSVYAMADSGSDPIEIAKTLNEQVGKVELILALRNT